MTGRNVRLIVNPSSGHRPDEQRLAAAVAWLRDQGRAVDRCNTQQAGHARELAADAAHAGYDAVLVCGGDGTINEAVNGLSGTLTALAVIPAGTANVWAKETGLDTDPVAAATAIEAGERRRVDLGRAGHRYFLMLASAGTDSIAVHTVTAEHKRRWGRAVYIAVGLYDLFRNGGREMAIEADDERFTVCGLVAIAGNTRLYGGLLPATRRALIDDGLLDLCVYQGRGWWQLAWHVIRTLRGGHDRAPGVIYRQARRIRIAPLHAIPVEADGEDVDSTPLICEAVPAALTVIVPYGLNSPLFKRGNG